MAILGLIHRDVGALHQLDGVGAIGRRDGEPDAGLDGERQATDLDRFGEYSAYPRQRLNCVCVRVVLAGVGQYDPEFVATDAGDDITVAQFADQPLRQRGDHPIAVVVSEACR